MTHDYKVTSGLIHDILDALERHGFVRQAVCRGQSEPGSRSLSSGQVDSASGIEAGQ